MYKQNIYDQWNLHNDATQLEINYNFLIKFIDILDVQELSKNINNQDSIIVDKDVIRKWKIFEINKILEQFNEISNYNFENVQWFKHPKIFVRSIFIAGDILNSLKKINYKASELNSYYEPKLFIFAEKYLELEILEEWVSMLSKRVFNQNNKNQSDDQVMIDWKLSTDTKHLKNSIWYLENLIINFDDITKWFNALRSNNKLFDEKKECIVNIMNHMIVYALTDFYAKYYTEITEDKYLKIYQLVLKQIFIDVNNHSFAIISFKQIAIYLNFLLNMQIINTSDMLVKYFLKFINISCSEKNIKILKSILLKKEKLDIKNFDKAGLRQSNNNDEGVPNKDLHRVEIASFENYKIYKTKSLSNETESENKFATKLSEDVLLENGHSDLHEKASHVEDNIKDDIPIVSYKTIKNIYENNELFSKDDSSQSALDKNLVLDDGEHGKETNVLKNFTKPFQSFKKIFSHNNNETKELVKPKHNINTEIDNNSFQEEVDEYE